MDLKNSMKELEEVNGMIKKVQGSLKKAPGGTLIVKQNKGKHSEYYHRIPGHGGKKRVYLSKNDLPMIRKLAQKEYDQKLYRRLVKQEKSLRTFCRLYEEFSISQVYESMMPQKREWVTPYELPLDAYIKKWEDYYRYSNIVNTYPIENGYLTKQGEVVRSKSEKIFADFLFDLHIPYLYETHLRLKDGHSVFPDFFILNTRTRETWVVELFGKMDDPDYANRTMEKIKLYTSNGYELGKSLLYLMESSRVGIDTAQMDQLIHNFLL